MLLKKKKKKAELALMLRAQFKVAQSADTVQLETTCSYLLTDFPCGQARE